MGIRLNSNALVTQTVKCKISDAKIRQYAKAPGVRQLKDERLSLYYVYKKDRSKGSWKLFTYRNGKQTSQVFANFPKTKAVSAVNLVQFHKEQGTALVEHQFFESVNDVLDWHITRQERLRKVESSRLVGMRSMFNAHLYSCFDGISLEALTHSIVDDCLIVALLSQQYSLSYVRGMFQLIKVAFSTAKKMDKLDVNPMSDMKWTDFIDQPIRPKPPKLLPLNILSTLEQIGNSNPISHALCMIMLYHGTRVGETRLAKWCHISFEAKQWRIPERNTKSKKEVVYPLTDQMVEYLQSYKQWLLRHHYKGNNVFPLTKRDKGPIHNTRASELVREVSKGKWAAHDLRKLARTVWADLGVDYLVSESLLNHAKDKLDVVYIHSTVELQKKEALISYHNWLKNCWHTCRAPAAITSVFHQKDLSNQILKHDLNEY
ncbi:site-specific integrase [Vibrio sp. 10N.261.55.A7]|uniref:site-specific integrase n=1 Tax=Vibrio sp. 10N.261.55.A7 TaxID=1880851 RepID=UPI000C84CA70|nr:site-specific integrase [Vibrio sp. 10N.261.55.A7]PMJ89830.1 integrase [Vibrio sp. 10N.261.55.A7]